MDKIIQKKKWTFKKIIIIALAGAFLTLITITLFNQGGAKLNVKSERLSISTVREDYFQEFIPVTGTIAPIKTFYLDAVEGGRVEDKFIEAGTNVKKGDRILKLGNTNLLMDIMYREAELFQQSNNLRNTRLAMEQNRLALLAQLLDLDAQLKKQKRLYEEYDELRKLDLGSKREYEELKDTYEYLVEKRKLTLQSNLQDSIFRENQIEQLENSLQRMEENLVIVKEKLDNLTLKAPISGQLTSLNAEIGESKAQGERLGQIDVLDNFKVRAEIDEYYISRIGIGQEGEFTFAEKTYYLIVKKVYPEVAGGKFQVDMEFTGEVPGGIRRGQTVHIKLKLGDLTKALLVDKGGFYQKTGGRWIYVVDEGSNTAVKREISIGRQNPEVYEVLSGLKAGEKVITSSYDNYGDNDILILK